MTKYDPWSYMVKAWVPRAPVRFQARSTDYTRYLTPVATARPGELVAMISTCFRDRDYGLLSQRYLETFAVQGTRDLECKHFNELSDEISDKAAQMIGRELALKSHPGVPMPHGDQEESQVTIRMAHFADALISVNDDWLNDSTEVGTVVPPILIEMTPASDLVSANEIRWKIRRYLSVLRAVLRPTLGHSSDWHICLPELEDLMSEDARARFCRAPTPQHQYVT